MDRRRLEDSRERDSYRRDERRRDDRENYRSSGRDRDEEYYRGSRDRSRSPSRTRHTRSKSPAADRRAYRPSDSKAHSHNEYRDLDRPEVVKKESRKEKDMEMMTEASDSVQKELVNDEEAQLAAFLGGVTDFASTKGKKVKGNQFTGSVDCPKKRREYRQYLFVKGAYDIPLTKEQLEAKEREQKQHQQQYE